MRENVKKTIVGSLCVFLSACSSLPPIKTVKQLNLEKFMGDWYVIACIPTLIEKDIYNPIESYQLQQDGTIQTTFTFRQGGFDGKAKTYHPKGFVVPNTGNALWGMQFIWPIKAEYRIVYLDDQYQTTIIARNARDYVWLMSRQPTISDEKYHAYVEQIKDMGYDVNKLVKIPQQWNVPLKKELP
jgi:apolipoprotein D and lipocalin family protein